jgi:hypothetical protein
MPERRQRKTIAVESDGFLEIFGATGTLEMSENDASEVVEKRRAFRMTKGYAKQQHSESRRSPLRVCSPHLLLEAGQ